MKQKKSHRPKSLIESREFVQFVMTQMKSIVDREVEKSGDPEKYAADSIAALKKAGFPI